ncbi:FAD/NAD(P)-binding domain-containing protein [Xylaria arbuscula]|nr:FAD/NAD(P)-binding domain-containing protein [Xylaria arbuscula]
MDKFDCVVIGAGLYGLGAAKQFHVTQPTKSLAILESQSSLGGTWADERLYPGLKSNNLLGTYEYPDFPMSCDSFPVKSGEHITGGAINTYFKAYAAHFDIEKFIHLETRVLSAEHQETTDGGWILTLSNAQNANNESKIFARRLIIATGLTSEPFIPQFKGQEHFDGKLFHSKYFRQNRDTLTAKTVTVFGASKFSWDTVYAYATAGAKVNWVIRSEGHGPCWMAPPYVTPLKRWIEKLANTRFLTWFSPCIWGDADGFSSIRAFYHGTAFGRSIVNTFWKILGNDVLTLNKYDAHPDTAKLKPWTEAMFTGPSFSILNYESDIFELVKSDKVDIYVGEISHLSSRRVHLVDGTEFESEVFVANTGWKFIPPIKFLPEGVEKDLGIPYQPLTDDETPYGKLGDQADQDILQRFPRLKTPPVWNKNYVPLTNGKGIESSDENPPALTPYMLYHFLVPASAHFLRTRDIAFAGMISNFSNAITSHLGGLWISAYFSGKLTVDPAKTLDAKDDGASLAKIQYETVLHNRWGRWRYPSDWGNKSPSFIFDAVPYLDLLQRDLGLNPYRKKSWFAEMVEPYGPEDYADTNREWMSENKA